MNLNTVDHLLTTTRSVRKRLDLARPVEPEVIEECLEIAIQAPTGSNRQTWHFVVVTDPDKRLKIADLYRKSYYGYISAPSDTPLLASTDDPISPEQMSRVRASSIYLAEHMEEVPILIICCIKGRPQSPAPLAQASIYGSILPAAWSLILALRARGLGASWTTLHLGYEKEVAEVLDIPDDITQAVLLPVGYFTGTDFKPAKRLPAKDRTHWNSWGQRR
jgi:nitroreductase